MKKRFRITEEQAKKILMVNERTQNQQSSIDPCTHFIGALAPSVAGLWTPGTIAQGGPVSDFGDIDCCEMLSGNMVGPFGQSGGSPMLQSHCDVGWSQAVLGYGSFTDGNLLGTSLGWADCCDHDVDEPCPPANSNSPFYTNHNEFCYLCPIPSSAYYGHVDCPCCDDDTTTTYNECERCDHPGEFRLNGQCIKCIEDVNNPGCCKGDGRVQTGDGCPDVECKNPNHVQGPPPECECECPEGSGEKGCKKGTHWSPDDCCCIDRKTGDCVPDHTSPFVGPQYT